MRTWLLAFALMLAGCAADADPDPDAAPDPEGDQLPDGTGGEDDAPSPGFAPQTGHGAADHRGLVLEGEMGPCDDGHCIDAEARNEGDRTLYLSDICVDPYADRLEKDGERVEHREPSFHCEAFGLRAFGPGDVLTFQLSWDGSVWDSGAAEPASGAYEWIVSFRAYEGAEGGDAIDLEIAFIVVAGET